MLSRLRAFQERQRGGLAPGGVELPWVWETELLAEVFLPETRNVEGAAAVLLRSGVEHVELGPMDADLQKALGTALEAGGIDVQAGPLREAPAYPGRRASPWRMSLAQRLRQTATRFAGFPTHVRGELLFIPYWNLLGVHRRL